MAKSRVEPIGSIGAIWHRRTFETSRQLIATSTRKWVTRVDPGAANSDRRFLFVLVSRALRAASQKPPLRGAESKNRERSIKNSVENGNRSHRIYNCTHDSFSLPFSFISVGVGPTHILTVFFFVGVLAAWITPRAGAFGGRVCGECEWFEGVSCRPLATGERLWHFVNDKRRGGGNSGARRQQGTHGEGSNGAW